MDLKRYLPIALLLSMLLVSPCPAKGGKGKDAGSEAAILAVVQEHNKALNAQDLKRIMDTFSSDPNIVLMGTGPGEAYVGDEAIGAAYHQFFSRFEANSLTFNVERIALGVKGNFAWFAVTTNMAGTLKGEKRERVMNLSGALLREKGKWRFVSMHFSRLGAEQQTGAEQPR